MSVSQNTELKKRCILKMNTTHLIKHSTILSGLMLCLASPLFAAETDAPHWSYEGQDGPEHIAHKQYIYPLEK